MSSISYYANRELSWLKFNQRVLEEAQDCSNPLCERLSFLSIFQSNLDEFFMVRVGSLFDQANMQEVKRENKTNMTPQEQLEKIFKQSRNLLHKKDETYLNLQKLLKEEGVEIVDFHSISSKDASYLKSYFESELAPLLSPQIIGKKQPFPFLQNKSIYAVVVLEKKGNEKLGIVPCNSGVFPKYISLPGTKKRIILTEEMILHFAPEIFSHYNIKSKTLIRIIRSADIDTQEETLEEENDYRAAMEKLIRIRKRLCPVKMEFSRLMDASVIAKLCEYLHLEEEQVFYSEAPLNLSFFSQIRDMLRKNKNLFYQRRVPQNSPDFKEDMPIIAQIEERDRFLAFPYERIKPFLNLLQQAGSDPNVVSIKMTLYRVATNSKIVEALIEAAENGKDVVVLVELRARFDEENNIEWSHRLEDAGCRIIYGLDNLKVHSKLCLITKRTDNEISYITQIGTGNYNEKTAEIYTDYSLMTARPEIGIEASRVFTSLCMGQTIKDTSYLLVAPNCLRNKVINKIEEEIEKAKAGQNAYIGIKVNSLTDKHLMDKLVEASKAGVKVDMIIRGINCLIAGIPNKTENISIRSIVGRFLEHTRVYIFGTDSDCMVYIASADFMTRNTIRRVEIGVPILDKDIKKRVLSMFDIMMKDNVKARIQQPDGTYRKVPVQEGEEIINSQEIFYEQAYQNASNNHEEELQN